MMAKAEMGDTVHFKCSESVITCQICMEIFESPRILPCQHTFCKDCVVSLLKRHCLDENGNTKKASFPCPNCRRECKIRRKGKHNIEEHLECFPESLLLKTFLDSRLENASQKPLAETSDETETQNENMAHDTLGDKEYGDRVCITRQATGVIEERLWFYCLFLCKLQDFLAEVYYSGSISKVGRYVIEIFLKQLLEIPRIINNPGLYHYHAMEYFDLHDIDTSLIVAHMLETRVRTAIENIRQNEDQDTGYGYRHVQTQTADLGKFTIMYAFMKSQVHRFLLATLIKSTFSVFCISDYFLYKNRPGAKKIAYSLFYSITSRKFRYWLLVLKMYDICFVIYTAGISIYWPVSLCTISYVLLLACFRRIQKYIGGGIVFTESRPLFPILLTSLNLFSNSCRGFVYCSAVIHLQTWLFIKLVLLELVPDLVISMLHIALLWCGKEHIYYRYGPVDIVALPSAEDQFQYE